MSTPIFSNRRQAGQALATRLSSHAGRPDVLVLALPRGGVPVAFEVAEALRVPLDVIIVRKFGVPGREEFAVGAVASGGVSVLNDDAVRFMGLGQHALDAAKAVALQELDRYERTYCAGRPPPLMTGKTILLVDDGVATGATMLAAVRRLRRMRPKRVVAAAPVALPEGMMALRADADEMVCVTSPAALHAVGQAYADFSATSDQEVRELLAYASRASQREGEGLAHAPRP